MRLAVGAVPVTERLATCGLPEALSTIVTAPFTVPVVEGVAVTPIRQFPPAANVAGQPFVRANGDAVVTELIVAAVPPLFTTVMLVEAVVVPTSTLLKLIVCGPSVIVAGVAPVPVSAASFGVAGSFEAMDRFAVCVPAATGLKNRVMVQLAEGAKV